MVNNFKNKVQLIKNQFQLIELIIIKGMIIKIIIVFIIMTINILQINLLDNKKIIVI